jgi:hypothetical protein
MYERVQLFSLLLYSYFLTALEPKHDNGIHHLIIPYFLIIPLTAVFEW